MKQKITIIPQNTIPLSCFKASHDSVNQLPSSHLLTAVYCRVSTLHSHQLDSLENQVTHYQEQLKNHPRYRLTKIYYDSGISGYKEQRPGFQKLLEDARKGLFQQIITKSITRFARNTATVLQTTRELSALGIDVYFELQGIHTISQEGEVLLTLYAAFGQAESENARKHTQMAIYQKYEKGQPPNQLHRCLGYEKNTQGKLILGKDAPLVQEIFQMAGAGYRISEITRYLNKEGIKTQNGKQFYRSTISKILHNNAYKGEYTAQRYYVDHNRKLVKNKGEKPMYYIPKNHIPIVSAKLWNQAQETLKYHSKSENFSSSSSEGNRKHFPVYCALCGHRLTHSCRNGSSLWECSGKKRFTTSFCTGVSISEEVLATLLEKALETTSGQYLYYIEPIVSREKVINYKFIPEKQWKKSYQKKLPALKKPELNVENYPYKDRIFCQYCGGKLRRLILGNGNVWWICNTSSRHGKSACKGIRIPDEKLKPLKDVPHYAYIGKEFINGEEVYGYTTKPN